MEASKAKSDPVPVVVRSEGAFNAGIILDESNYDVWSQLVEMHIAEREKLSFIRGMPQPPAEKDEGYEQWYAENQKVKRWILMSMKPEIMKRYLRLKTAHEIWIALSKAFYDGSDELQVFALNQKAFKSKQGGRSVSEYYGELVEIFRELDHRDMVTMKDPEDVKSYHDAIERLRVHIFLAGLDETFEQVRGEMLRKDLLPSLEECYAVIRREAVRRETLNTDAGNSDVAVMIMKNKSRASRGSEKPNYKCTKCNKSGHTKERCYEVIGYPDWWDHNRGSQRKDSNGKATTAIITAEAEKGEQNTVLATTTGTLDNNGKALLSSTNTGNNTWIIDSACSDHITFDASKIQNLKSSSQKNITTADGSESSIIGEGTLSITENLNLDTVLVVPDLKYNLLSVSQITKSLSCVVIFWPNFCVFKSIQTRKTIGCGIRRGKLYYLDLASKYSEKLGQAFALEENSDKKKTEEVWLWHKRMGHVSFGYLKKLFPNLFEKINSSNLYCDVCELAKSHRTSFPLVSNKSNVPFMIIHSDVWGRSKVPTLGGSEWFVTFIDDCTRVTWLWIMKSKGDVAVIFQKFCKMVETQYKTQVRVLRSDNGGEYMGSDLKAFMEARGIVHQTTCPYTPQQNGVAERKNRHLLEVVRASLIGAHMPSSYWGEAITYAVHTVNRTPSRSLEFQTPLQALNDAVISPRNAEITPRVFGCVAYVHLHKHQRDKLSPRAEKCVFLGYAPHQKGYRCYHPSSKRMLTTMDVVFHEQLMYFEPVSGIQDENRGDHGIQTLSLDEIQLLRMDDTDKEIRGEAENVTYENVVAEHSEHVASEVRETEPEAPEIEEVTDGEAIGSEVTEGLLDDNPGSLNDIPHQSSNKGTNVSSRVLPARQNRGIPKSSYEPNLTSKVKYPMSNYVSNQNLSASNVAFMSQLSAVSIPNSVQEALANSKWTEAMNVEMDSLQKQQTWEIVECPEGKRPVGCRWIYSVKYNPEGTIDRFKARLVAKGYTQAYGVDYTETFAPVAKINTVRVLLSLAANWDWPLQQFDVKNAFLHGELSEEVYMELPEGCKIAVPGSKKVCKLKKALYGLKQSPRAWFGKLTKAMKAFGYSQSNQDHTLFLKKKQGKITALIVYVDDMLVTGNDSNEMLALQEYLSNKFDMKDLGVPKYFLGIEVSRSKKGIFLCQKKYILDLLKETGMTGCKPANSPTEGGLKLCIEMDQIPADVNRYRRLVGKLMYLAHTRPDLAYALSMVSSFMHNPGEQHMNAVIRILRYLKGTIGKGVLFKKTGNCCDVDVYTDADWAGAIDDRRSTSGYFTFLGGNLVTWRSKKQTVVARSSAEAELRGLVLGLCEGLWLKMLLRDLGCMTTRPIKLYCDNKAARDIAHNPIQHDRMKHVDVDRFFIKEKLEDNALVLPEIRTEDQLADMLTKAVSIQVFWKLISKLGMYDIHAPT